MDVTAAATLFAWVDREVWLVTARAGDRRGGLIATFIDPASIVPDMPRMVAGLSHLHHTRELVEASGLFALHLLSEENLELVWRFGLQSGRDVDKFAGLEVRDGPNGCPIVSNTIGWLECRVETRQAVGDRTFYVAEVLGGEVMNFAPPLRTQRLLELAPPSRLSEMQRRRHHDGILDGEAIRGWRELNAPRP